MTKAGDRLREIYDYYQTNASKIEARYKKENPESRFSKQSLLNIEKGNTKTITPKMAGVLLFLFEQIDQEWLLNGTGKMLIPRQEKENLSSRLKHFILFYSGFKSIREFERDMHWNNGTINNLNDNLKIEKLLELKEFFPNLNTDWLMSGKGQPSTVKTDSLFQTESENEPKSALIFPQEKTAATKVPSVKKEKLPQKEYQMVLFPIEIQNDLQKFFYAQEYIEANCSTGSIVSSSKHKGNFANIEFAANGNSLFDKNDWLLCEEISLLDLYQPNIFEKDKTYCFLHPSFPILFARVKSYQNQSLTLSYPNEKKQMQTQQFHVGDFKMIFLVRRLVRELC